VEQSREAIILAGGFGTRLANVVPDVCKPMAPVAGRPFLRYVLNQLDSAGFGHVVIADGYRREQIENYFMGTYRGLQIDYSSEDEPLLTGGAVKKALAACSNDRVFVLNGDTWFDVDFTAMEVAAESDPVAVLGAKRMRDFDRYGTLDVASSGLIRAFREKAPCDEGLINGGVYLLRHDALDSMPLKFSLETEFFEKIVDKECLNAVECAGSFIDIGVPEDYQRAQMMFEEMKPKGCRLAMFDRDGTINVDTGHLHEPNKIELIPQTVRSMQRYAKDPAWRIAVVTNQAGIAKGFYGVREMRETNEAIGQMLAAFGVDVAGWYFCPHHPDYTGPCECRKPRPGMLLRAMRDFGADPAECVMYGDMEKDRLAAKAAGVRFVAVEGGASNWFV
jgi:D-glycero-alpha-D-manno-heptose 1-phosphate guanylyltransferase